MGEQGLKGMERAGVLSLHGGPPNIRTYSFALLGYSVTQRGPLQSLASGLEARGAGSRDPTTSPSGRPLPPAQNRPGLTSPGSRATVLCWEVGWSGGCPQPSNSLHTGLRPSLVPSQEVPTSGNLCLSQVPQHKLAAPCL